MAERHVTNMNSYDLDDDVRSRKSSFDREEDEFSGTNERGNAVRQYSSQPFNAFEERRRMRELDLKLTTFDLSDSVNYTKALYDRNQDMLMEEKSNADELLARRSRDLMKETEDRRQVLQFDRSQRLKEQQAGDVLRSQILFNSEKRLQRFENEGKLVEQKILENRNWRSDDIIAADQRHRDNTRDFIKNVADMEAMASTTMEIRNIQTVNQQRRMNEAHHDAQHEKNKLEEIRMSNMVRNRQQYNLQEQHNVRTQERIKTEEIANREAERRQTYRESIEKAKLWNDYEDKVASRPYRHN